jgi:hypothetical protein
MRYPYFGFSFWHGLKVAIRIIFQNSIWVIGDGKSIMFWSDRSLDFLLLDKLHAAQFPMLLMNKVASFIIDSQWEGGCV